MSVILKKTYLFLFAALLLCFTTSLHTQAAQASSSKLDDPMVRISGSPLGEKTNDILKLIATDVCKENDLAKDLITFTWQDIHHMVWDGKVTRQPVFVDLYVPGFFTKKRIGVMLESIAQAIHTHTGIEKKWVFIHTHFPQQGHVYINGGIMEWETQEQSPKD